MHIEQTLSKCNEELVNAKKIKLIDKNDFQKQFYDRIEHINLKIKNIIGQHEIFINSLIESLQLKKKNLFEKSTELILNIPDNFSSIEIEYETVLKENNEFSKNLSHEQEIAKNALRFNEIKISLDNFSYNSIIGELEKHKIIKEELQISIETKKIELNGKLNIKNQLILQTRDERKIANQINKLLKNMGVASFSLELIDNDSEQQKGQYKIKGQNSIIRPVTDLSQGEKNIIAFLYFILSLDKVGEDRRPKIIILDDPMTSNDDTMQYLMIGEIQKYYRNLSEKNYIFTFTHNAHFYLNIRPNTAAKYKKDNQELSHYSKFGNYHLFSNGTRTTIRKIENGKQDFSTNYEMLWRELIFLYESNEANLMLNVCRKICETYMHFTKKSIESFYGENISAKKLFDVNQHSIDDFDAEQNGKTRDEIITILKSLFENNNAKEHFNNYFITN